MLRHATTKGEVEQRFPRLCRSALHAFNVRHQWLKRQLRVQSTCKCLNALPHIGANNFSYASWLFLIDHSAPCHSGEYNSCTGVTTNAIAFGRTLVAVAEFSPWNSAASFGGPHILCLN
jgi:hypothetical protein